ncbi:hypothetical protein BC940DRAFT_319728 [Gongronella butleri]|nr:hypothetical protein BC940DRAFT_319728 [Gongronella butleri]
MPRKVRDLVNVGYRYYHPEEQLLNADEVYFQMRTSLTTCEMILVRALDCNLEIELPFACCLNVLRAMGAVSFYKDTKKQAHHLQKDVWKQMEQNMPHEFNVIARLAWLFLWDSLASPRIVLTHKTHEIALGSLYLALRMTGANLDMSMTEWVDQWGAAENVSVQSVRDVIQSLMELHDDGVQYVADHKKDAELLNRSSSSDSAIDPHSPTSPQE